MNLQDKKLSHQGMKNAMRAMKSAMKYVDANSTVYADLGRAWAQFREDLHNEIGRTVLAQINSNSLTYSRTPAVLVSDLKRLLKGA